MMSLLLSFVSSALRSLIQPFTPRRHFGASNVSERNVTQGTDWNALYRDRYNSQRDTVLQESLLAWRLNPLARRLVILTRQYVTDSIEFTCPHEGTAKYLKELWDHPLNRIGSRLPEWCDELTLKKISGTSMRPALLKVFPEADKIAGSENYIVGGILGHAFLPQGVVSEYHSNGAVVKAFIAPFPSPSGAQAAFEQYKQFLSALGKSVEQNNTVGERSFCAPEPYHKNIIVAQQGCFVAGITELSSPQQGTLLLKNIIKNLKKPLKPQE